MGEIQAFTAAAHGVASVCRELGWPTYSDPEIARRGCAAPGVFPHKQKPGFRICPGVS
ncbi:MAG: hypothetical protein QM607_11780 [Microbacterium sp.]